LALNNVDEGVVPLVLIPIILSGGAAAPLRLVLCEAHPKPFLKLPDSQSLLLQTLKRALSTGARHVYDGHSCFRLII